MRHQKSIKPPQAGRRDKAPKREKGKEKTKEELKLPAQSRDVPAKKKSPRKILKSPRKNSSSAEESNAIKTLAEEEANTANKLLIEKMHHYELEMNKQDNEIKLKCLAFLLKVLQIPLTELILLELNTKIA